MSASSRSPRSPGTDRAALPAPDYQHRQGPGSGRMHHRSIPSISTHVDADADSADNGLSPIQEPDTPAETPAAGALPVSPAVPGTPASAHSIGFGRPSKPGIVRKTKPPPIMVQNGAFDRLSMASVSDLVKRASNSIMGIAPAAPDKKSRHSAEPEKGQPRALDSPRQAPELLPPRNRKRVLGLPWWAFALIILGLIVAIVICVVVPIQVTAKRKHDVPIIGPSSSLPSSTQSLAPVAAASSTYSAPSATSSALTPEDCQDILPCENSGVSVVRNDSCACICVGDFGGTVCQSVSNSACGITQVEYQNQLYNITLGSAIIPLLSRKTAARFPSVTLDSLKLVEVFNNSDVSCTSQNALVMFDNSAGRRVLLARTDYGRLEMRAADAVFNVTDTVLDFARIVVLDVVQANSSVSDAVYTQELLQEAFDDDLIDPDTGVVELEEGVWVNFNEYTVSGI